MAIDGPSKRKFPAVDDKLLPSRWALRQARMLKPMGSSQAAYVPRERSSDEMEIVERARSGDAEALSILFARDRDRLYRIALALLRNREDAEDAVQDALLSAYVNLGTFEGRARFTTWLCRIVWNSALMKRRRLQSHCRVFVREDQANDSSDPLEALIDDRPDPELTCALAEAGELVRKRANELPPLLRSAFYLRDVGLLSTTEAAGAAGAKVCTLKSRSTRARHRIADLMGVNTVFVSRSSLSRYT
jgi:RNA polymerase sigma-70 factor, ECF subfamily